MLDQDQRGQGRECRLTDIVCNVGFKVELRRICQIASVKSFFTTGQPSAGTLPAPQDD